jgi:hypothetical protein
MLILLTFDFYVTAGNVCRRLIKWKAETQTELLLLPLTKYFYYIYHVQYKTELSSIFLSDILCLLISYSVLVGPFWLADYRRGHEFAKCPNYRVFSHVLNVT